MTAEIGAKILLPDGRPKRRKGGAIVRSAHDVEANMAERYVRRLSDFDLTRMLGFDPMDTRRRHDTRRAFDRLHADGVIDLRREGRLWRIFAPVGCS